jgi:hypothetical protein
LLAAAVACGPSCIATTTSGAALSDVRLTDEQHITREVLRRGISNFNG